MTVKVPGAFAPIFLAARAYVSRYFSDRQESGPRRARSRSPANAASWSAPPPCVEFFDIVDELRRSHESLESRVRERTADLEAANARLRAEIAERQAANVFAAMLFNSLVFLYIFLPIT